MALVNEHLLKLPETAPADAFAARTAAYRLAHPDRRLIDLSRDTYPLPLPQAVGEALHRAIDRMAGGGTATEPAEAQGCRSLREAMLKHHFLSRGIHLDPAEIFVNDGTTADLANLQELLRWDNSVGVAAQALPVYTRSNAMIGRTGTLTGNRWSNVTYFDADEANGFVPLPPDSRVDMIYLASPNPATGAPIGKELLRRWVNYALHNEAVIFYDATHAPYLGSSALPHSIYEIKGARKCAVEFFSHSRSTAIDALGCGYTLIPQELKATTLNGDRALSLNHLWAQRRRIKSGGPSLLAQQGAEALYTADGQAQLHALMDGSMDRARRLRRCLEHGGLTVYGGEHAPLLWVKAPAGMDGSQLFDQWLYGLGLTATPGTIYGPGGESYVRLSAGAPQEEVAEAIGKLKKWATHTAQAQDNCKT